MEKVPKLCTNCTTNYTIIWDKEEQDLEPLTCPFCGYEVEEDSDIDIPEEAEDDSWNWL